MNIKQLLMKISSEESSALDGIPQEKAAIIVREAFSQVIKAIQSEEEGTVIVAGLGQFRIRQVQRDIEGKTLIKRQVSFRPAKGKGKEADAKPEAKTPRRRVRTVRKKAKNDLSGGDKE